MKRILPPLGLALACSLPLLHTGLRAEEPAPTADSAETPSPPARNAQDEIQVVVTATRSETAADQSGASVSVVTRQEIQERQYRNLAEALQDTPGLTTAQSGTPGQATGLFLRGTKTENTRIMIDGRRLPFNLAGAYNLESLTLDNVERIEVVRGPMSAVQGGPAIGGVINIISRDGRGLERPELEGSFEAGSFQTFREAVGARGAAGPFDFSVEASRLDTNYQRTNNEYRRSNIQVRTGYQINEDLYADVLVLYNLADAGSPNTITNPDATANLLRETWLVSPGLRWQTTDWWKQSLFYSHAQQRQVATEFPPAVNFFAPPPTLNFGQNNRLQVDSDQVDYQSDFQIASNWSVSAGVSFTDTRYYRKIDVPNEFNFPVTPAGTKDIENNMTNTAGFLSTQWQPLEGWALIGSVRFDHESDFGTETTWRLGTNYRVPHTRTLLHASYGTGFSPPTPQDIAPTFGGNQELLPERSRGWDVGVEQPLWDDRLVLTATYFENRITNLIQFDNSTFTIENIADARIRGMETGLRLRPWEPLTLSANYTLMEAWNLTDDLRLVRRPRHQLSSYATYRPIEALALTLGGLWVVDREDAQFPGTVDFEDYFLMRFAVSWQVNSHVEVFGRIENLLDEQYQEVLGFPALDRAFYAGFTLRY